MMQHDRSGEHPRGDLGQFILLVIFLIVWIADSFFLRWTTAAAKIVPPLARWPLAALLITAAGWLAYKSHGVLHMREEGKKLWTGGVYRHVRHPMYLGALFFYLGLVVLTMSLASLAVLFVIILFYDFIAGFEDKFLEQLFDREYADYKAATPKWLPKFRTGSKKSASGL